MERAAAAAPEADLREPRRHRDIPWWTLPSVLTIGTLSPVGFLYVGLRCRSGRWLAWAGAYLAATVVAWVLLVVGDKPGSSLNGIGFLVLLAVCVASVVHAIVIRHDVGDRRRLFADPRLREAKQRVWERRYMARLAQHDPELARELRIGTGATQLDGGLVDVNHAPRKVLMSLPGMDAETASRIVGARADVGGFSSVDDLGEALNLDAQLVDELRGRTLFLPL